MLLKHSLRRYLLITTEDGYKPFQNNLLIIHKFKTHYTRLGNLL